MPERVIIDLSQFEKYKKTPEINRKECAKNLTDMMAQMSERINRETEERYGIAGLLNPDCSLNMDGYAGDLFTADQVQKDKEWVHARELDFSRANVASVRDNSGSATPEDRLERWKREKNQENSGLTEMVMTRLFDNMLGGDYLVVRASAYDDYNKKEAAVDNIMINIRTGEAICAFDDVSEGGAGERTGEKEKKIRDMAVQGGAHVRYGMKMEEGKLKRAEMYNVPVFYLGLTGKELTGLLGKGKMDFNPDSAVTPAEYEVFGKLVASLKEQSVILNEMKNPSVHFAVRKKSEAFAGLLEEFENMQMAA